MNTSTPDQNKTQARRALIIAIVFIIAILANLGLSLFLGAKSGEWQQYARAGVVFLFGIATILAISWIKRGQVEKGIWLIISGFLFSLTGTALLLAGLGLILGLIELVLVSVVAGITLQNEQRLRALVLALGAAAITFGLNFVPLNYRVPAPPQLTTGLPIIAALVILAVTAFIIRLYWNDITQFIKSSIRNRLTAIVVGAAIVPVLLISITLAWVTYTQVRNALTQDVFDKLSAVETIKHTQLLSYLAERKDDMVALGNTAAALRQEAIDKLHAVNDLKKNEILRIFEVWDADVRDVASDPGVVTGIRDFEIGFQVLGAARVRALYLGNAELENAGDETFYSIAHAEQHGFFAGYTAIHGYEDAYLIDPAGNVIYSALKGNVFGTNLVSGPFQDSNLATLYQNLRTADAGQTSIVDMAVLDGKKTMFIGTPIYQGSTFAGILAYQLSVEQINNLMQTRSGLSESFESYLVGKVGQENQLRSDRVVKEGVIGDPKPGDDADLTLAGEAGHKFKVGSTGNYEISVFAPLEIPGLNWAIITTGNVVEIFSPTIAGQEKDFFSKYAENYGYGDLYLIGPDGYIFYSTAREADYQTNILTGEYSGTNLGELVNEMNREKKFEIVDFDFFAPAGGTAAAFFGVPLLNESNQDEIDLFVAAEVPVDDINQIMNEAAGLGESGESYIIGQDFLGRMDSRFIADFGVETTVLNPDFAVDTEAVRAALAGETGQGTIIDYRGLPVMSSWSPIVIHEPDPEHPEGQIWAVLTEIDETEALASVTQLAGAIGLVIGLATLAVGALAVFIGTRFAAGFVTPILNLTETATQVAAGDLSQRTVTDSVDEIGTLSNAFNTMTAQLQETLEGLEERVAARTKDLATVADISTTTTAIRNPDEMLARMVHLTQRGFNLYHAHVFTYQKDTNALKIVACGYKEGDENEGTHGTTSIPISQEQSLVARAARTRQPVIVNDVQNEPGWLPNPLLPDTRAELAVPMIVGDELLGVLDVQAEQLNAFTNEDANIQMTLASQIATALQNAQAYTRTQKQAELEAMVNLIGQRIQRATSIEDTLQTAIRELGTAIGATRVRARIGDSSPTVEPVSISHGGNGASDDDEHEQA